MTRAEAAALARAAYLTPERQLARFWARVQKTPTCWLWLGTKRHLGYGVVRIGGTRQKRRSILAHRFTWELMYGPIPPGLHVCHHCDNPPCVRPSHLFLGTQRDNMQDAMRKGRLNLNMLRIDSERLVRRNRLVAHQRWHVRRNLRSPKC